MLWNRRVLHIWVCFLWRKQSIHNPFGVLVWVVASRLMELMKLSRLGHVGSFYLPPGPAVGFCASHVIPDSPRAAAAVLRLLIEHHYLMPVCFVLI
ncbi:hypothetical protein TNCV_2469471 [Trichonephila clavipes]|nr:hypothetical protein TNCV_2469471 [Trichonephila clavipes]